MQEKQASLCAWTTRTGTRAGLLPLLGITYTIPETFAYGAQKLQRKTLMDLAAHTLEEQGFVKIAKLDARLPNGEQDYEIKLTEEGAGKLWEGIGPAFRDLDM